jgi:hypothetical protein
VAEVHGGIFSGLFTAGSAYRADTTQGRKIDRVLEAPSIGAKSR